MIFAPEVIMFLRLVFGLFIDLLIANGYLLPEQRELWVGGALNIIGALGATTLLGIYQYQSHKHQQGKTNTGLRIPNVFGTLIGFVWRPKKKGEEVVTLEDRPVQDAPTSLDEPNPNQ